MRLAREFMVLSLGTVFALLLLSHYHAAGTIATDLGGAASGVYGTLQGRSVAFPSGVQVYGKVA